MADAGPYRFLLAIDGSQHANRAAEYLFRRACPLRPCEVDLIMVGPPSLVDLLTAAQRNLLLRAGKETEVARKMLDVAGIPYRFHAELGDPAKEIVRLAGAVDCHEVVTGTRGMSALEGLTVGSVAYTVVHESPVPVTVVPNPRISPSPERDLTEPVHRILLAVDGSKSNNNAIDYVCALRDASLAVNVCLLNVQLAIDSGNVRRFVSQETIDDYWRKESETALAHASQALQRAGLAFESAMLVGHPAEKIAREAQRRSCTRIVMGTRGLGAFANVVIGSTALDVIHRSSVPVTLVK